jgi:hypothetical protein
MCCKDYLVCIANAAMAGVSSGNPRHILVHAVRAPPSPFETPRRVDMDVHRLELTDRALCHQIEESQAG